MVEAGRQGGKANNPTATAVFCTRRWSVIAETARARSHITTIED